MNRFDSHDRVADVDAIPFQVDIGPVETQNLTPPQTVVDPEKSNRHQERMV